MVVSLVCACVRIGEHLDLLDGTKQNQRGGGAGMDGAGCDGRERVWLCVVYGADGAR